MKGLRWAWAIGVLVACPGMVRAYFDPGTSASLYGILSPVVSFLVLCLGFFWRPVKRLWRTMKERRSRKGGE